MTETELQFYKRMFHPSGQRKPTCSPEMRPETPVVKQGHGKGFNDIAGMQYLKHFVTESFINVIKYKQCAATYGINVPSMLLAGPPGCGKTYFIEKMKDEVALLGVKFLKINPDELASPFIHGTQEKIAEVFKNAASMAPVVLFFDEFDAMVPSRNDINSNPSLNSEVNEFLCMLNNCQDLGIYVIAATNHPEKIDRSCLRSGRLDEIIFIDMPDLESRKSLFSHYLAKIPADKGIDIPRLASLTEGYNCSDIHYMVKSAARQMFNLTIRDGASGNHPVSQQLLEDIIHSKAPSVTPKDLKDFERIREEFMPRDNVRRQRAIGYVK